jgi:hypothetical protein
LSYHAAAGIATILLVVGAAAAQTVSDQTPTKAALPTRPIFQGGFSRPIYQGGFPRIMPFGLPNMHPDIPRDNPAVIDAPDRIRPAADSPAPTPAAAVVADADHAHDQVSTAAQTAADHAGCTGACADDSHQPVPEGSADNILDALRHGDSDNLLKSIEKAGQPPIPVQPTLSAKDAAYCMKCHHNGIPVAKGQSVRAQPPDLRIRTDIIFRRLNNGTEVGMGAPPDMRLHTTDNEVSSVPSISKDDEQDAFTNTELVGNAPARAVDALRAYTQSHPDDFRAMRLLALAHLGSKHPQDAAAVINKAYASDPLLSKEPIDPKALALDPTRLTALANAAAAAARLSNTSQAWLLAATVYQAQNAKRQALNALESASKAGLDADVADWLAAELKKK